MDMLKEARYWLGDLLYDKKIKIIRQTAQIINYIGQDMNINILEQAN